MTVGHDGRPGQGGERLDIGVGGGERGDQPRQHVAGRNPRRIGLMGVDHIIVSAGLLEAVVHPLREQQKMRLASTGHSGLSPSEVKPAARAIRHAVGMARRA